MIELNKKYSTKELAQTIGVSYGQFRNIREKYESHLALFYDFTINTKGNGTSYIFNQQLDDYIPYKEYSNAKRSKLLQKKIKQTISNDTRQTGSKIARIIKVDNEIQALDLQLSTLTNYTRVQLKKLVDNGYYVRDDYRWCYLDKRVNKYILMSDEEVSELRSYFKNSTNLAKEEEAHSLMQQRIISSNDAINGIGKLRIDSFNNGIKQYQLEHGESTCLYAECVCRRGLIPLLYFFIIK